jgi:hypothetical protein
MGLRPNASVQQPRFMKPLPLPFVIPSEAEGSAVPRTFRGNVFDRAWRSGELCNLILVLAYLFGPHLCWTLLRSS